MKNNLTCIFLLFSISVFSQTIRVENGFVFSKFNLPDVKDIITYAPFIGIDYCIHKNWNLSNEIGLLDKGGTVINGLDENGVLEKNVAINLKYLQLNALVGYKLFVKKTMFYGSIGPKVDILVSKNLTYNYFSDCKFNKLNFGLKPSIGIDESITSRFSIGIKGSYLIDLNNTATSTTSPSTKLRNTTDILMLSLKYVL